MRASRACSGACAAVEPVVMIDPSRYPRLSRIDTPADLRRLEASELRAVSDELRAYLIESVGRSGGHFGAGLGVIELTVALHYLYDTPEDRIVWDVGHQTYPHKILTGRRDAIHTVKQKDGVAPFPKHFRIATAMMKGPATLQEIAEASGVPVSDVADFINANLATGFAEPWSEPAPEPTDAGKPGLFGRLRGR